MSGSKVRVEKVGNRIHLVGWVGPTTPAKCRSVGGASFSKNDGPHWTYPLTLETCYGLRRAFATDLEVGPELATWAKKEQDVAAKVAVLHEVSHEAFDNATLDNLPERAPTLFAAMLNRPYQIPAARFLATVNGGVEGDQPGMGKTLVAAAAILERHANGVHLIVAPVTSTAIVWAPELKRWLPDVKGGTRVFLGSSGGKARRQKELAEFTRVAASFDRPAHLFLVVNAEMLRTKSHKECRECNYTELNGKESTHDGSHNKSHKTFKYYTHEFPELFDREWNSIVVDESHKYLITANSRNTLVRRGAEMLKCKADENGEQRIAMSGTPFKGKTKNIWGTLNWVRPSAYTSMWSWYSTYLDIQDDGFGKTVGEMRRGKEDQFYSEMDRIMIRRTKKELRTLNPAWAPPEKQYDIVRCLMHPTQHKQYLAMEKDAAVAIEGGNLTANGVLAEMTRLKQFAHASGRLVENDEGLEFVPQLPSGKFERIVEMLDERGITGNAEESEGELKVVIGSQFTAMINLYAKELQKMGIACSVLTGQTSASKRKQIVDAWQGTNGVPMGPERVFLINTMAGGVSITLDSADELWVLDETWIPDDQEQLEDRVHRTGNVDHQVTIYYFCTLGTIEEQIAEITASRDATQKMHLDGRRGVEFARSYLSHV